MSYKQRAVMLIVLLASPLSARQASLPSQAAAGPPGIRDKDKENAVAKLFETIRVDAKIPPLTRIKYRKSLEQTVCTITLNEHVSERAHKKRPGFYKTSNPESISPELNKLALFNDLHPKYNWGVRRYSVAVWRVTDPQTGEAAYWVGVQLYWSAVTEFVDSHFTDDIYYRNAWKKSIALACRDK